MQNSDNFDIELKRLDIEFKKNQKKLVKSNEAFQKAFQNAFQQLKTNLKELEKIKLEQKH